MPEVTADVVRSGESIFSRRCIGGTAAHLGMPNFGAKLSVEDADALRAFVIKRAHDQPAEVRAAAGGVKK
jgi:hypothetical protein